jgi:SulP family sulfate permease
MPAPLLGIALAVMTSNFFGWTSKEIGLLPDTVPPFVGFSWSPADVFSVLPAGFALAFVSSVNLLVTSRVVQHFQGRHIPLKMIDADRELGAYGIANLASGMFGAPMSVGIPARSVANIRCGGSTRMSILYHAAFLMLFLKLGGGTIAHIPVSALAGITAWMGLSLMSWGTWARLPKMRRLDAAAFLTTAIGTLLVNAIVAVAAGCTLYGLRHLYRTRFRNPLPETATEVVS